MDKYYFGTSVESYESCCTQKCMVLNTGVMIGSVKCQECPCCVEHEEPCEHTGDVRWIKCNRLDEAIGDK